jgi:DNA polymerase
MYHTAIPRIGAAQAWRDAARSYLAAGVPPDRIVWSDHTAVPDLFGAQAMVQQGNGGPDATARVPRSFVAMAQTVVWHSDPERFARLYSFLWRVKDRPHLMADRGDADLSRLRLMEKNVHRCKHKMKAFVRFREIGDPDPQRRSFAAWFEPTHHTVEPTADFFVRRFSDMDWRILTPDVSAIFVDGTLAFKTGEQKPDLPPDAGEDLWITYFRNIFNPARLKVKAMQSEMPRKYWKNMPEAAQIPDMIAGAASRAAAMAQAAPSLPPARVAQVRAQLLGNQSVWDIPQDELPARIAACTRCPLHLHATQAVPGAGPGDADLMIVGEQPGDLEDLSGQPFVGPAGQLFDGVAASAGLDRRSVYITNAVKHFKFTARGRRRIHQRPTTSEIGHCRWWLEAEIAHVAPKLILAMGATAAEALTGDGAGLLSRRGRLERHASGIPVLITLHPSYLLRLRDPQEKADATTRFRNDLQDAVASLARLQQGPAAS